MADDEIRDVRQLPEIEKAINMLARSNAKTLARASKSGVEFPDGMIQDMAKAAATDRSAATKSLEKFIANNPDAVETAATLYALKLAKGHHHGHKQPNNANPEISTAADEMTAKIRDMAREAYQLGEDKSKLAKRASEEPAADFNRQMKESLVNNPHAVELMKELPNALKISAKTRALP